MGTHRSRADLLNALITLNNLANPELHRQIVAYMKVLERLILANHNDDEQEHRPAMHRRVWMWPYIARRRDKGHYHNLMRELAAECPHLYKAFTRINEQLFNSLVETVTPIIRKQDTFMRQA